MTPRERQMPKLSNDDLARIATGAILGVIEGYALCVSGRLLKGFLIWLIFAVLAGITINDAVGSRRDTLLCASVAVGTCQGAAGLVIMMFLNLAPLPDSGFAGISGISIDPNNDNFRLDKALFVIGFVALITVLGTFVASFARPVILAALAQINNVSEKDVTKIEKKLNLWGKVLLALSALLFTAYNLIK